MTELPTTHLSQNAGFFMENQDAVCREVARLLASQLLAVLATQDTGQPYASLLAFAVSSDLADIL